jgi:uncharacterized ParB-like nuclease family protein
MSKPIYHCMRRASAADGAKSTAWRSGFVVPAVHGGTVPVARCSVSEQWAAVVHARPLDVTTLRVLG